MTLPNPAITLDVDLTNPGQFLACCGLLELASRLDPEAVGWFRGRCFNLCCSRKDVLSSLVSCRVSRLEENGPSLGTLGATSGGKKKEPPSPPIVLGDPFDLVLDWWTDDNTTEAGFKTWSAGMTVLGFIDGGSKGKGARVRRSPGDVSLTHCCSPGRLSATNQSRPH